MAKEGSFCSSLFAFPFCFLFYSLWGADFHNRLYDYRIFGRYNCTLFVLLSSHLNCLKTFAIQQTLQKAWIRMNFFRALSLNRLSHSRQVPRCFRLLSPSLGQARGSNSFPFTHFFPAPAWVSFHGFLPHQWEKTASSRFSLGVLMNFSIKSPLFQFMS